MSARHDFEQSWGVAKRWLTRGHGTITDNLDQSIIPVNGEVRQFRPGVIAGLAARRHDVEMNIDGDQRGPLSLRVMPGTARAPDGRRLPVWWADGHIVDHERACALLRERAAADAWVRVTLRNEPDETGLHWIRTPEALLRERVDRGWLGLLAHLMPSRDGPAPGRRYELEVAEAGCDVIEAPGLIIHGPEARPCREPDPAWIEALENADRYASRWLDRRRSSLPPPAAVLPLDEPTPGSRLEPVARMLEELAEPLTWTWLASSFVREGRTTQIGFGDAEPIDLRGLSRKIAGRDDPGETREQALAAVKLWDFATKSADRLRREAVLDAYSMQVRRGIEPDITAVHSRAARLHGIAERDRIGEAAATVRSSRRAAYETASRIADTTRATARSIIERAFVQIAAVAGIVLAHLGDALSTGSAVVLLIVVLALTVGTYAVAFWYEYPAARRLHKASIADLEQDPDLSDHDIDIVRNLQVLEAAQEDLQESMQTMRWFLVLLAAAFVLVTLAVVVL